MTENHLSQVIHTVMNYLLLMFLLVDECLTNNIDALELVEHGHSEFTIIGSKTDKPIPVRYMCGPLRYALLSVEVVPMSVLWVEGHNPLVNWPLWGIIVSNVRCWKAN